MGIADHLTCLLRNLYAGQETTVRTRHRAMDWFKIRKGVCQGCLLSPCLFNLYAEYIIQNTGLDESQTGIKIVRRNINNLTYADDTTLMGESKEELKSLLMRVKAVREKGVLKLSIQNIKIMASSPVTSWQIDWENAETVTDFIFLGSKITVDSDCSHEIKRHLLLGRKVKVKSLSHVWLFMTSWTIGSSIHGISRQEYWSELSYPSGYDLGSNSGLPHYRQTLYHLSHQGSPSGKKAMTNLDNVLKSRDITLPTKVHIVKSMVFPVVTYGRESWTIKNAERWRIDAFKPWCQHQRLLRIPWTARRSNKSILKEFNPEYSLERLILKLNLQSFGHMMWRTNSSEKTLMLGKTEGRRTGETKDETVVWHHQLYEHELEPTPGDCEGQGNVAWCVSWGCKELDVT